MPSRENCFECIRGKRWPEGVKCIYCGGSKLHKDEYTDKESPKYYCLNYGKYFNDLTNTILDFIREVKEVAEKIEESVRLKISWRSRKFTLQQVGKELRRINHE